MQNLIHFDFGPVSTWVGSLQQRLKKSSSLALRGRLSSWGASKLSGVGVSVETKFGMARAAAARIRKHEGEIRENLLHGSNVAERLDRASLQEEQGWQIALDLDSLLFELLSAYDLLSAFVTRFCSDILCEPKRTFKGILDELGKPTTWLDELKEARNHFNHVAALWPAVKVHSSEPLVFEFVALRDHGLASRPGGYLTFSKIEQIWADFDHSLGDVHSWMENRIAHIEHSELATAKEATSSAVAAPSR